MNVNQSFWTTNRKSTYNKVNLHDTQIDYENCKDKVQTYISENASEFYISSNLSHEERKKRLIDYILEYLNIYKPIVSGYIEAGELNQTLLSQKLIDDITNHGFLTEAMRDDTITEIRINEGCTPGGIWIEKHGKSLPLTDSFTGEYLYFKSPDEVDKFINNLLKYSKISMSTTDAIVNGSTLEGYRVAAADSSVTARTKDILNKTSTCVIRKFSGRKMTLRDLVAVKTISSDMAKFLSVLTKVDLTCAVIGSTGSGKTITLQAILEETPLNKRIILIQNPPEIDMSAVDENGVLIRDIVTWEAKEFKGELAKRASSPTYPHLMDHSLRFTPYVFVFGELRMDDQFVLSMKASNTGHNFYTTFHSKTAEDALNRYVTACLSGGNGSENLVLENVCSNINFIISQRRLADGTRKVIGIDEICGIEVVDGYAKAKINPIFRFIPDESREKNKDGTIKGVHAQVGTVSEQTKNLLLLSDATQEEFNIINRVIIDNPIVSDYEIS
jgi:pilus assembly protein CpaF